MKRHLFFDMDLTLTPARQKILPEMYTLLDESDYDVVIVSGQTNTAIAKQSRELSAYRLGQNGNEAYTPDNTALWQTFLEKEQKAEILAHIDKLISLLDEPPKSEWLPIEDRGAQITFSPIGNVARQS